jgi:hypothetical protein
MTNGNLRARVLATPRSTWWATAGAFAVVLLMTSPVWMTKRGFAPDWSDALWMSWHQGVAIRNSGLPSLYLLADSRGVFEPFFGFYGGPLYGSIGAVSALLGNRPEVAFVLANIVAVSGAYGGMVWLGHQIGGSRLAQHLGAVVFISSPYYLTDLYARGAFAEFVALSSIPLVLAAGLSLLRGPWRARSVIAFAFAVTVLSGSHNLTLVWGTAVLLVLGVAAYLALPRVDRPPLLRLVALLALAAVAIGVNSWAFIFNLLYNKDTKIGSGPGGTIWTDMPPFNAPRALFDPFRQQTPSSTPGLTVAAPMWAIFWGWAVLWRASDRLREAPVAVRRLGLVMAGGVVLLLVLIMWPWVWSWMPDPLNRVQFPYRLNGYIAVLISMSVPLISRLAAGNGRPDPEPPLALGVTRPTAPSGARPAMPPAAGPVPAIIRDRPWVTKSLVALFFVSLIPGMLQAWSDINLKHAWAVHPNREAVFAHGPQVVPRPSFYDEGSYHDWSQPIVANTDPKRRIDLPMPKPGGTKTSLTVLLPGTLPVITNIAGGPYAVTISGPVKRLGRTADGLTVIRAARASRAPVTITASARGGALRTLSWALTAVCALAIAGFAAFLALRDRRRRRAGAGPAAPAAPGAADGWDDAGAPGAPRDDDERTTRHDDVHAAT